MGKDKILLEWIIMSLIPNDFTTWEPMSMSLIPYDFAPWATMSLIPNDFTTWAPMRLIPCDSPHGQQ